ncbi:MAG TPA: 30S ribosomal protein S11 [bacterium]
MAKTNKSSGKKVIQRGLTNAIIHIHSTFNNTIISVADETGNILAWSSGGSKGFKGSRKGTPYAAQIAAEDVAKRTLAMGIRVVSVYVRGPGPGRETALRALQVSGLKLLMLKDVTPIPHNGCRPPKKRRV